MAEYTDAEFQQRVDAMRRDMIRYEHEPPSPDELEDAPLLSRWYFDSFRDRDHREILVAVGIADGRLGKGLTTTSQIVARGFADGDRPGWIRTRGRLYRLGTPAGIPLDLTRSIEVNDAVDAEGR